MNRAVGVVAGANLKGFVFVEAIHVGDGEAGHAIDHAGEAEQHRVQPATAARAAGDDTEFPTEAVKVFGEAFIDSGKWAGADAGGVGFANTDDALDGIGREAGAGAGAAGGGVGGGDEGISPVVDVEQGALRTFEKDGFPGFPGSVEDGNRVGDVRTEAGEGGVDFREHLLGGELRKVVFRENFIHLDESPGDLGAGEFFVE